MTLVFGMEGKHYMVAVLYTQVRRILHYWTANLWVFQSSCCCNNLNLELWSGNLYFLPRIQYPCFESDVIACYCLGINLYLFLKVLIFCLKVQCQLIVDSFCYLLSCYLHLFEYGAYRVVYFFLSHSKGIIGFFFIIFVLFNHEIISYRYLIHLSVSLLMSFDRWF